MNMNAICAKIKRAFKDADGAFHPIWRVIFASAVYFAAFYGVLYGLAGCFGALFNAWGLTNDNLSNAPIWAQRIVYAHTDFCYAMAYLGSSALCLWITRRKIGGGLQITSSSRWKNCLIAVGIGLVMSSGLTLAAFALDSVRLNASLSEPTFSVQTLAALLVIGIGKFSHETLCRRAIYAQLRAHRTRAILISSAVTAILIGEWSVVGMISGFLLGVASCALYERGGLIASALMQTVWTAWCTLLFQFPTMSANANPVYSVYHVSDAWLTGGNGSVLGGAWCALTLAVACAILYRKEIVRAIEWVKRLRVALQSAKKKRGKAK